ncbi:hypothetical protein CsatB_027118 [Cannabis sativa]
MLVQDRVGPKSSKQTQIKSLPTHHHPGRLSEPKNLDFSTWVSENLYKVVHVFVLINTVGAVFFLRNVGDTAALLCFENHVEALEKIEFPKFESKVSQFMQMFNEIHRKMDDVFSRRASPPIRNLEQMVKDHQRFINEQKSIMQSLRLAFLFFSTIFLFVVFQLPFEISEVLQQKSAPFGNLLVSIGWYFHLALVGTWHL